jgi:hypothetical protein
MSDLYQPTCSYCEPGNPCRIGFCLASIVATFFEPTMREDAIKNSHIAIQTVTGAYDTGYTIMRIFYKNILWADFTIDYNTVNEYFITCYNPEERQKIIDCIREVINMNVVVNSTREHIIELHGFSYKR